MAKDKRLFVPADYDDAGLDPYAYRLFCRIVRRCNGQPYVYRFYESVPNLAKGLKMGEHMVRRSLKTLEQIGAITRQSRQGKTDLFAYRDAKEWNP